MQLIKLSLIQGIVYVLFAALYAYNGTYTYITQSVVKSRERVIIDGFITTIDIFLYTVVSKTFRKELVSVYQRFYRHLTHLTLLQ